MITLLVGILIGYILGAATVFTVAILISEEVG